MTKFLWPTKKYGCFLIKFSPVFFLISCPWLTRSDDETQSDNWIVTSLQTAAVLKFVINTIVNSIIYLSRFITKKLWFIKWKTFYWAVDFYQPISLSKTSPRVVVGVGGYPGFQVTGMIEGFCWVWNFRFWNFFGYENLASIFLGSLIWVGIFWGY